MTDQTDATGHTEEPWLAVRDPSHFHSLSSIKGALTGKGLPYSVAEVTGQTLIEQESNAARIVQCVNALAGIPDPAAFVKQAKEAAAAVQAERERCLAWVDNRINPLDWLLSTAKTTTEQAMVRYCLDNLRLIRQRIESGETP